MLSEASDGLQARKRMKWTSREERSGPEQGLLRCYKQSTQQELCSREQQASLLADLSDLNPVGRRPRTKAGGRRGEGRCCRWKEPGRRSAPYLKQEARLRTSLAASSSDSSRRGSMALRVRFRNNKRHGVRHWNADIARREACDVAVNARAPHRRIRARMPNPRLPVIIGCKDCLQMDRILTF
ncbi:hypothetical protein VTN96DRAFT_2644 [Rasamsonia emersonii]